MTTDLVFTVIKDFGLPVALVVFFVVQNSKREAQTNQRLDAMTAFQQETLVAIIKQQHASIHRSNEVHEKCLALVESHLPKS